MSAPETPALMITLRRGDIADAEEILRLFDESVVWLVAHGREEQWGTEPWSTDAHRQRRIRTMLAENELTVADLDGRVVAALVTGQTAPAYIPPADEPERYIHLLIASPAVRGSGVGATLLDHARHLARTDGIGLLRVDSWGGGDRRLVAYYVSQGFTPVSVFERNGWVGQVYEQRLD